jgi:hypothetical protein
MKKLIRIAPLMLAGAILAYPALGVAGEFNPNNVITDETIRNSRTMSLLEIQRFLDDKGGLGRQFDIDSEDGLLKGAAQLIYDAAQRNEVNPKYLLALIQKESSAVESSSPSPAQLEFATGYGVCDSCSKNDPIALKNKGFGKQVEAGAGFVKWFWENHTGWPSLPQPGEPRVIDGLTVVPANRATAALYGYTPHLHGNRLLNRIWVRWWGEGTSQETGIRYPDGSLVRNEETGQIALIRANKLRTITSPTVLASRFAGIRPINVSSYEFADLARFSGPPIRLVEPSIVRTEDDRIWLLVNGERRLIASSAAFVKIGFNPEELEDVSLEEISDYPEGTPLTADSANPAGYLAQDPRSGGWWWIEDKERRALHDRALLQTTFLNKPRRTLTAAEIDSLLIGPAAQFPDGTLVKDPEDPTVYVISDRKRRPITSEAAFLSLGYRWTDIWTVSRRAVEAHQIGEIIDLMEPTIIEIGSAADE